MHIGLQDIINALGNNAVLQLDEDKLHTNVIAQRTIRTLQGTSDATMSLAYLRKNGSLPTASDFRHHSNIRDSWTSSDLLRIFSNVQSAVFYQR